MSNAPTTTQALRFAAFALLAIAAGAAYSQTVAPTNSLPNPYRSIENWAKMPEGRSWGSTAGVWVDRDPCGGAPGPSRGHLCRVLH